MCEDYEDEIPHDTIAVPYKGGVVRIDIKMVPVVTELWSVGIDTRYCCEGYPEDPEDDPGGYIMYQWGIGNTMKVINILAKYGFKVVGIIEDWDWNIKPWNDMSDEAIAERASHSMYCGPREWAHMEFVWLTT